VRLSVLTRRTIAALMIIMGLGATPAAGQGLPSRLVIDVLYLSTANTTRNDAIRSWAATLQERLQTSVGFDASLKLPRGNQILVRPEPLASSMSGAQMKARWEGRRALQVVFGHAEGDGASTTVAGTVYLGDLKGDLPSPALSISQPINAAAFRKSSDLMMAISLYALAVDSTGQPKTACALLQRANVISGALPDGLESAPLVKAAITKRLQTSRCSTVSP
jgi:hypothetical protein